MDYGDSVILNQSVGSGYRSGIRAGDFQTPGPFTTRGTQIGNTFAYSFDYGLTSENIIQYSLTGPGFIPLLNLNSNIKTASLGLNQVALNIPRTVKISGSNLSKVIVSGYEFYDRKMTCGKESFSGETNYESVRPFKALTSVYVECSSYPQNITISTSSGVDVPYTVEKSANLGGMNLLQILSVTSSTGPFLKSTSEVSLPYFLEFGIPLTLPTTDVQTLNGNVLRPVVKINDLPNPPSSYYAVTFWFATTNYEYALAQLNNPPQIIWDNPYPNNLEDVIGPIEPYSIGWTDWKG